ncbi:cadherin-like domain-containing protein [Vibrio natriegens]|uniref:cadherin-like domain-containing protein n=1 Tax=Vibrio natriegens TaxID=691 RepID=UPI0022835B8C|nr:cadherin-like domain-containing protein [Vibrio natriegens]MCY9879266.1 cadherin-like domain-containing protein [Vibrio natriegens]
MSSSVFAASGDFSNTDFAAAAPFTYNHSTGGGAYNDRTVGEYNDVTEQLLGAQFSCSDTVTFLANIEVSDTPVDALQTIELDLRFLADSTGQSGAAISDIVSVSINYGQVENGDNGTGINPGIGAFGLDSGISDDNGSTATLVSKTLTGPLFQSGSELLGTVRITDLEAGENVILRVDTTLSCQAGSSPTGNLQGQLDAGRVISPVLETINTGQQTIPFLRVGDIAGAGEPLLEVEKTVTTESGTCGINDVEELSVLTSDTVKYCYTISNPGTQTLFNVELTDDNGTPGDMGDDFTLVVGDVSGISSVTVEQSVTLQNEGTVINTAVVSGNNGLSGGNFQELVASDTATVYVEQIPNNPPNANNDSDLTTEDIPVTTIVTVNDTDIDGNLDPSSATLASQPANGSVTNNGDGTFTYIPNTDFNGQDSYDYQVCDTYDACDTATVTISILAENDPPIANDDSVTINQGTFTTINTSSNDSDVDGNLDPSSIDILNGPSNGTIVNNGDGTVTYTPDPNFFGTDSFTYEICDTDRLCDTATVTITVLEVVPVNTPPAANDDINTTPEDTAVTINATANDTDAEGNLNPASATVTNVPADGSVISNGDGSFTYTPAEDFNGTDSFEYQVCDTDGECDTATVTIDVTPVNDPPVALDDSETTPEDTPVTVDANVNDSDVDADLDPSTAAVVNPPANGTVASNGDGTFTYLPDANFSGSDSFTYQICDEGGLCDTATVTINVTPVNDPPAAEDDLVTTPEDTPVTVDAATNDSDVDGNLDPSTASVVVEPEYGTVTDNGDGTFTYIPAPNANGPDSFTYQICDTDGLCDTATVYLDVTPVNDPPVANDDTYTTLEDVALNINAPGILGNDSDLDGDSLSVNLLTNPSNGTVSQNADGSFTYTPALNFNGMDSYTYEACDPYGDCDEATVTIYVGADNDPPEATDDAYTINEDTLLTVTSPGVLSNDSDVDGDPLTVSLLTNPSNGTLTQNADGSFTYMPNANFNGIDSYTYEACDTIGVCDSATVTITVVPVNDPPVAEDDSYSTTQDASLVVSAPGILNNDSDLDGDNIFVDNADTTSSFAGIVSVNSDGSFSYTPDTGFAGIDTFNYTISDGNGGFNTATVTITVEARNNRSITVDLQDYTLSGTSLSGTVLITNQSDGYHVQVQSLAIEVQYKLQGQQWTYVAVSEGSCSFSPEPLFQVVDQTQVNFYACELTESIPTDATVRVISKVNIFGRIKGKGKADGWFLDRLSK